MPHQFTVKLNKSMNLIKPTRFAKGFTLIELLMVITVISLLMAVVFPVIGLVRDSAKATICRSNLHQLGTGILAYTMDWKGYIVPGTYYNNLRYEQHWFEILAESLEGIDYSKSTLGGGVPDVRVKSVLKGCPSYRQTGNFWQGGFGMNAWLKAPDRWSSSDFTNKVVPMHGFEFYRFSGITKLDQRCLVSDSGEWHSANPEFRHRGQMSVLTCDLRVTTIRSSWDAFNATWNPQ